MTWRIRRGTHLAALLLALSVFDVVQASTYSVASLYAIDHLSYVPVYSSYAIGYSATTTQTTEPSTYSISLTSALATDAYTAFRTLSSAQGVVAMLGPAGTSFMLGLYEPQPVGNETFALFGPLAQSVEGKGTTSFMNFMSSVYWTMPSEQAQAVALLVMLAEQDRMPFSQHVINSGSLGIGNSAISLYSLIAPIYGIALGISSSGEKFHESDYNSAMSSHPGIVYQYGEVQHNTAALWSSKIVADSLLIQLNTTVATTFEVHYHLLQTYITRSASVTSMLPPENFITAAPVPGVDATEYVASVDFVTQAESSSFFDAMPRSLKNYMMAGWVSGSILMQALNKYMGSRVDSARFSDKLYDAESSFVVSDLFIGTFGQRESLCSLETRRQNMLCACHHGGNNIWFHTFRKSGSTYDTAALRGELKQYALTYCANLIPPGDNYAPASNYARLFKTPAPIHVAGVAPIDNTMMQTMCEQTHDVITRLSNRDLYQHTSPHVYRGYCVPTSMTNMTVHMSEHKKTFAMTSTMGVFPDNWDLDSYYLDYIPQTTQTRRLRADIVYLFPTLDQELYVLASYLSDVLREDSVVCGVAMKGPRSLKVIPTLKKSLRAFGIETNSVNFFDVPSDLVSSIPSACTHTFVIGAGDGDASKIVSYLTEKKNAVVLASFDDLTKQYTSLALALNFAGRVVTNRFVFATNLPSWTSTAFNPAQAAASAPLSTVEQFLQSVPEELHTPAAVRAYYVAMLYDQLSAYEYPDVGNMRKTLYREVSWTVAGLTFGPYTRSCIDAASDENTTCLRNYGAQDIAVWSYTRVLQPSTALLQQAVTPSMVYDMDDVAPTLHVLLSAASDRSSEECNEVDSSLIPTTIEAEQRIPSSNEVRRMIVAVGVCLCIAVATVLLLLLVKFGVLPTCTCFVSRREARSYGGDGSSVLYARERQHQERLALQRAAHDMQRAPFGDGVHPLTFVSVDVVHYRQLWASAPELMACAAADYERSVRQSIVRHECYEMIAVDGLFVIACNSADAGVSVARDCAAACCSGTRDASTVDAAYAALKCGSGGALDGGGGLRLRIAVHNGTADVWRTSGLKGGVRWSGGAVDDAVCAACCSRTAWQIVVTESARRALKGAEARLLEPLDRATLPHSGPTQLFSLSDGMHGGTRAVLLPPGSYNQALRVVARSTPDAQNTISSALCRQHLRAYVSCCCFDHDTAYLTAVAHSQSLPAGSRDDYADDRAHAAALLRTVGDRIGMLLECRHRVLMDGSEHEKPLDLSCCPSVEMSVDVLEETVTSRVVAFSTGSTRVQKTAERTKPAGEPRKASHTAGGSESVSGSPTDVGWHSACVI